MTQIKMIQAGRAFCLLDVINSLWRKCQIQDEWPRVDGISQDGRTSSIFHVGHRMAAMTIQLEGEDGSKGRRNEEPPVPILQVQEA